MIHLAPPCGPASRAREKKIHSFRRLGITEPQPLRSDEYPDGLPGLKNQDQIKTEAANLLYSAVASIVLLALDCSIHVSAENPASSLMWQTTFLRPLTQRPGLRRVLFHNCAHGSTRDKPTCFLTNADFLSPLELRCDKSHKHDSWKPTIVDGQPVFPTHFEVAYPELF